MNKKVILLSSLALVVTLSFGYIGFNKFVAKDESCLTNGSCSDKKQEAKTETISKPKAGGEDGTYEFITDKVTCDDTKNSLRSELMSIAGVKDVSFSVTCCTSKMTNVIVTFSEETTSEKIAASLKEKNMDCSKSCDKESKTGGCTKQKKSTDKKDI